jgi:dihydroorotate dehydrogenase
MAGPLGWLARSALFRFDPETAHRMAIRTLALGLLPSAQAPDPSLRRRLFDLDFPSPVGLAAGFDKDAEAFNGLLRLGFGFVEVGTVTPRPQPGNPKPRMFRLESDGAIINRLGFNNEGMRIVHERLWRGRPHGIVGVNVGANRNASDRIADYVAGIETFADIASYLAINVSSPNTPGLRDLQHGEALRELLQVAVAARDEVGHGQRATPLLLKIAPDLQPGALEEIADAAMSAGIDGLIVANTTTDRRGLRPSRHIGEAGGLSGRPLFRRSTMLLARLRRLVGPRMVLIGVGGIDSVETAWSKITAGADLIQIYTGMIYRGHGLAAELNRGLAARLAREGIKTIGDAVGMETDRRAGGNTTPST